MMLLKYKFSGLHVYSLLKTLIACRAMQLIFLKAETLLNNAFDTTIVCNYYKIDKDSSSVNFFANLY